MRPDIYVHPLSPRQEDKLKEDYRTARGPWSRTRIGVACPLAPGGGRRTLGRLSQAMRGAVRPVTNGEAARGGLRPPSQPGGRIIIELAVVAPGRVEVIVTRACDSAVAVDTEAALLKAIVRLWPEAVVTNEPPDGLAGDPAPAGKRGGPAGTPEHQKLHIVRGWLNVQGRMNQEVFAGSQGIAASTLRRWMRQLRAERKL